MPIVSRSVPCRLPVFPVALLWKPMLQPALTRLLRRGGTGCLGHCPPPMRSARPVRTALLSVALLGLVTCQGPVVASDTVAAGRYTRIAPTVPAAQADPMLAVITISFPEDLVRTTGDAARHLLRRSGYDLVRPHWVSTYAWMLHTRFLGFELPEVHRRFDSVRLIHVLEALAGPSYRPVIDHGARSVWFEPIDLPESAREAAPAPTPALAEAGR